MYQVFLTEGEYEPWWFFDDWKSLIVKEHTYNVFEEALNDYHLFATELSKQYPFQKTKKPYVSAFWNNEESEYCESCEDDIQIFHGVMLLKNEAIIQ